MTVPKEKLNAAFWNGMCVPRWYVADKAGLGVGERVTTGICTLMCACFLVTNLSRVMVITRQENMCGNECTFP